MELLSIFQALMRHRVLVAVGCVVALLAGVAITTRLQTTGPASGAAARRVLIDQDRSLVSTSAGKGTLTIARRATLLANLMATDDARNVLARGAGIAPADLAVIAPAMGTPVKRGPLPERAADASTAGLRARPYVMTVALEGDVPILSINVTAPDRRGAERVAGAATAGLDALIAARTVDRFHGLVATPLGAVRARAVPGAVPRRIVAPAATVAIFGFWCCALIVLSGLARAWRRPVVR